MTYRYRTDFGIHSTLELAASFLGITIEQAERRLMRGEPSIRVIKI